MHRKDEEPKRLRRKNYIYELVKNTDTVKQPDIDVILQSYIEGVGNIGDKVSVRPSYAYNKLLLSGLAVYASPENIEKYASKSDAQGQRYSSPFALYVSNLMNIILKQWYIKVCLSINSYSNKYSLFNFPETLLG